MPRMHNSIILVIALGSGLMAFLISLQFASPKKVQHNVPLVVTAIRDIPMGTSIKREYLDLLPAPAGASPQVLYPDFTSVLKKVSRKNIAKGDPIKSIDLLGEGENLASLIPNGYRAMTIPVSLATDLKKMLDVGNRVDVLLTYEKERGEFASLTLVTKARVIGITDPSKDGRSDASIFLTLAVTPEGAETLAYAIKKGTLSVSIYPALDNSEQAEKFFTLKELFFKEAPSIAEGPVVTSQIQLIRGLRKETYKFGESDEE